MFFIERVIRHWSKLPRVVGSHHIGMYWRGVWMWHLWLWFRGSYGGAGLTIGLDYIVSSNPDDSVWFYVILCVKYWLIFYRRWIFWMRKIGSTHRLCICVARIWDGQEEKLPVSVRNSLYCASVMQFLSVCFHSLGFISALFLLLS